MATTNTQALLNLAKKGAKTKEEKRLVEKAQFNLDGKYTFAYVKNLPEFESRLWMLETSETSFEKIKKRYNTRINTSKNAIFSKKPGEDFYMNLLQNTAAEIWFDETFNTDVVRQGFRVKCLSLYKLNRMEYEWIIVGNKSDLNANYKVNTNGVPFINDNLIFVTYQDQKFRFFGALKKEDYNKSATYGKFPNTVNLILTPTEYFDDREFKDNLIVKDLKTLDELPARKKTKKFKLDKYSNIAKEKIKLKKNGSRSALKN